LTVLAIHENLTGGNRIKPGHHLDQRRLARPGFPQQNVELTRRQRQRRRFDMRDLSDPLGYVA